MEQRSLYVSKYSPASQKAVEVCTQLGLVNNITIVGIDNPTTRELIKHGKLFAINVVPTLVTELNGSIKLYQGTKAIEYMQAMATERSLALQQQQAHYAQQLQQQQPDYNPKYKKSKKQSKKKAKYKSKMLHHLKKKKAPTPESDSESSSSSSDSESEDEDPEYEDLQESQIQEYNEDDENNYETQPGGAAGTVSPRGKIQNLGTLMTQMQVQREQDLGYEEKRLPAF